MLGIESLEQRLQLAVTASFIPSSGTLVVIGDALNNTITVSRNPAGTLMVNSGAVPVLGGTPTVANTALIQIFGLAGNDRLALDETNGALPRANLFGGAGNDTLLAGSGADMLFGQAGNDALFGRGGADFLFGGSENDALTGGDGNDQVFGESGNDRMVWNPGDDTDLNEGGDGIDTVEVFGGNGAEIFTTTANGLRVRFDRLNPAPFSLDIGTSENLILNAGGGNDTFSATGNLAALIQITVDGGTGNDTILGSNGADVLLGGDGNDLVDGQQGNDLALLGAGDDIFQWDPGDGSDVVEGQDGLDTMRFNGSAANEIFDATTNGQRVRFTRNVANIVMDLNDIERINLNALGGTDTVIVNDLSGTDLVEFNVDLAGVLGGSVGDGQADAIIANGANGNDTIDIFGAGTSLTVLGLPVLLTAANVEGATDSLVINALGGNDRVTASTLPAGIVRLAIDGGDGNDTLLGSSGADVLLGGDGNDLVDGQQGNDLALLGAGDDIFQWDPGDGSDAVEGQAGLDTMRFNGSNASESFDASANGGRLLFFRNVGNIAMDLNDVEVVALATLGGTDTVVIGDLSGTDVVEFHVNLGPSITSAAGDGQADQVTVNGTNGSDVIVASTAGAETRIAGLAALVRLRGVDAGRLDTLQINALGGDDVIDASALTTTLQLIANGGLGDDVFLGSAGDDRFVGGDGNDLALMDAGDDLFTWNPGDDNDIIEGQAGFDTLLFNGANVSENITIAANGGRVIFFRNVASVTMDLNDVESIDFNALGGADTIVANDLSGTDVVEVNVNLAGAGGGGDAQPDNVIVNGTAGDDVVLVVGDAAGASVLGLAATVNILAAESALDRLTVNALAGDDVVEASGLAANAIQLTASGGDDDDVLIGGDGNDVLLGGAGDDVLLGGPGIDILDGGDGDNIVIQ